MSVNVEQRLDLLCSALCALLVAGYGCRECPDYLAADLQMELNCARMLTGGPEAVGVYTLHLWEAPSVAGAYSIAHTLREYARS